MPIRVVPKEMINMFDQAFVQDAVGNDVLQCAIANVGINPRSTEIADHARSRLRASPYLGVRTLDCEFHEGVLVLRGRVTSYYHKQMAQEAVRNLRHVELIINAVEVVPRGLVHSHD
jgi:hypothetical protein